MPALVSLTFTFNSSPSSMVNPLVPKSLLKRPPIRSQLVRIASLSTPSAQADGSRLLLTEQASLLYYLRLTSTT